MPLKKGTSNRTRSENVAEMSKTHPVKQAVAASYRQQRESRAGAGRISNLGDYAHPQKKRKK